MDNELDLIEEYASLFFSIDEISVMLNINSEELRREIRNGESARAKAYKKGRLKTEVELRRTTKQFAEKGSPQAEALMIEYNKKQKLNE
jgi:hypothetical protein